MTASSIKHFLQYAFIVCALIVFSYPLIRFNKKAVVSEKENRYLASFPSIFKDNHFNKNFFSDCNAYLSDRFGLRLYFISLNSKINHKLHAFKGAKGIQGKNGWFFYIDTEDGNNYADFMKQNLLIDENLETWKENVKNTATWCKQNGIKAIFLICPNKHSVYSEYYPFSRPLGNTRTDQLTAILDELGVEYIFPRDVLLQKKAEYNYPLYYETDTHWNPIGAYCAFELLKQKIYAAFPERQFPEITYNTKIDYSETAGDILPMLNIKKARSTLPTLSPVGAQNADFYEYIKNDGTNGVITHSKDTTLPRTLIFRDSFFSALEPFTSPLFSDAEYIGKRFNDGDKEYILNYQPDLIIFEAVERYSANLVQCSR